MKFVTLLIASSCLAASAFGVTPPASASTVGRTAPSPLSKPAFKNKAESSALFRSQELTRGGAVPGWAAYNEQLDKNPLTAKALTSLVGWALGDILAQVRSRTAPSVFAGAFSP